MPSVIEIFANDFAKASEVLTKFKTGELDSLYEEAVRITEVSALFCGFFIALMARVGDGDRARKAIHDSIDNNERLFQQIVSKPGAIEVE